MNYHYEEPMSTRILFGASIGFALYRGLRAFGLKIGGPLVGVQVEDRQNTGAYRFAFKVKCPGMQAPFVRITCSFLEFTVELASVETGTRPVRL